MTFIKYFLSLSAILVATVSAIVYFMFIKTVPGSIIQLNDGKVQGVLEYSREGKEYNAYYSIPFTEPPIGSLRFKAPIPNKPWTEEVWDASYRRAFFCAQYIYYVVPGLKLGSEDCLYLDVFHPSKISPGKKLPVIVHIHGGYFHMMGVSILGPNFFMDHEVIVVNIPYRLGALGFLSTGDKIILGNNGLKDQHLGLKWVQANIEKFGGDKDRVTIVGESAGGASVHYHSLGPSKGLFSRAIRQSGSALNYWTMFKNSKSQAQHFAKKFSCPTNNSENMLKCLQSLDVHTLLNGHKELVGFPTPDIEKFAPTIEVKDDDAFLTENPFKLLKSGQFHKVPVLSGFNADEGLLHSTSILANQTKLDEMDEWFNWAPKVLHYDPELKLVSQKIRDFYFGTNVKHLNSDEIIQNVTTLFGDRFFNLGITQSAILEKKFVPTYLYLYDHQGGLNLGTDMAYSQDRIHPLLSLIGDRFRFFFTTYILQKEYTHNVPGTCHGDEGVMLWSSLLLSSHMTSKDVEMSKSMVKLWVDFASDNKPFMFRGVEMLPSKEPGELQFLHLTLDNPKMIQDPYKTRRTFWEQLGILPFD